MYPHGSDRDLSCRSESLLHVSLWSDHDLSLIMVQCHLVMVQCHELSDLSLIMYLSVSWSSVSCKISLLHDLWSVFPHGSVSCSNYLIFDQYLLMVQCHVRTTWSLIWISSLFSVMYVRPDLWSVSPHGSVSCKIYMIFDLYFLLVQCHVRTTWSFICISSRFSAM